MTSIKVTICGIEFNSPLIAASGTFGFGREYSEYFPLSSIGGVATKGLTLQIKEGNPTPRIAETASGILNSVGLQNPGVEAFIANDLSWLKSQGTKIIANIAGNTEEDYVEIAKRISPLVDMVELNISCPNVKCGGIAFGVYPQNIERITSKVKAVTTVPLIVKLSPNVASIRDNAVAAQNGGADAISLINTITGMAINARTRRPILANITGGLSGPSIKPIALRMVYEVARAVNIPIIGMGGIMTGEDVVEFLLAGATAVEIGTANISDPLAMPRIQKELIEFMGINNIEDIRCLTGGLIL